MSDARPVLCREYVQYRRDKAKKTGRNASDGLLARELGVLSSAIRYDLARLLAVEFQRAGWTVKIADLDTEQGTSTKCKARRDRAKLQPEIPVEKFATVQRAIREAERFDLTVLDGPAHTKKSGRDMAKAADLFLMPTGYGPDDLEAQIEAAYELEESGTARDKIWFVFCRTTGSPAEDQAARDYLTRAKINVFEPVLPELPSIRQGHNAGEAASEISFPAVQGRAVGGCNGFEFHWCSTTGL